MISWKVIIDLCVYPTPLSWAGCDSKSISKPSKDTSFSQIGWLINSLPCYVPIDGKRMDGFTSFPRALTQWNANSLLQDLNSAYWFPFLIILHHHQIVLIS